MLPELDDEMNSDIEDRRHARHIRNHDHQFEEGRTFLSGLHKLKQLPIARLQPDQVCDWLS